MPNNDDDDVITKLLILDAGIEKSPSIRKHLPRAHDRIAAAAGPVVVVIAEAAISVFSRFCSRYFLSFLGFFGLKRNLSVSKFPCLHISTCSISLSSIPLKTFLILLVHVLD